jgi:hypothetical protein
MPFFSVFDPQSDPESTKFPVFSLLTQLSQLEARIGDFSGFGPYDHAGIDAA